MVPRWPPRHCSLGALGWRGWMAVVAYLGFGSLVTRPVLRASRISVWKARGGRRGPENVWGRR